MWQQNIYSQKYNTGPRTVRLEGIVAHLDGYDSS